MHYKKIILLLLCIALFLIPFILWGNNYIVGGDDTKLYYVFPMEFITNYALNVASDNTLAGAMTGYQSVAYFAPFFAIIYLCKLIPLINTQMLFYGSNFAFSFLFFYQFLTLYLENKTKRQFSVLILSSIMYTLSVFILKTLFTHQLLALYLLSTIPATLYLLIKGIRLQQMVYILISVLIFSLFSTTLNTLPWWGAFIISSLPLLAYEFILNVKGSTKGLLVWGGTFFLLNFYWIFHTAYAALHNTGLGSVTSYYTSASFVADNVRIITGVSRMFSPFGVLFFSMNSQFPKIIHLIDYFQLLFISIILLSTFIIKKNEPKIKLIFLVSLLSLLLSWFLFSPNLGDFGQQTFLLLSKLPFFTMFRNMYDKFSLSLAFYFAFCFAVGFTIVSEKIKRVSLCIVLFIVLVVTLFINIYSSLIYVKQQTAVFTTFSGTFDNNFTKLANYFKGNNEASHILWLPLNAPTYINVTDAYSTNHQYIGLSPLRELANIADYAGKFSFIRQNNLFIGDLLFKNIQEGNYNEVGKFLQQVNTKYIVVNNTLPPTSLQPFFFNGSEKPLLMSQNQSFTQRLLGSKIADFGNEYSLYRINDAYLNEKLYLTDNYSSVSSNISQLIIRKNRSDMYTITIPHLATDTKLVFLEPYNSDWVLSLVGKFNDTAFPHGKDVLVFGYANGWNISKDELSKHGEEYISKNPDGTLRLTMQIFFAPMKYNSFIYSISILTLLLIFIYIIYLTLKYARK